MASLASRKLAVALFAALLSTVAGRPAHAAPEKKEAAKFYAKYLAASEARMKAEIQNGPFLFIDAYPDKARNEAYARIRSGSVEVKRMNPGREGQPPESATALIHDWVGVAFIPGVTLAQTLAVVQDYANYDKYYRPNMRQSRILSHQGDNFKVALQLYYKSIVTVVFNAECEIRYQRPGPGRAVSHSRTTRLLEVKNAGRPDQREFPGLVWGLNDYWRFEAKDGGVYVQLESIAITRSVPAILAWLVDPLINSIPRGVLNNLLTATRSAVLKSRAAGAALEKTAK